jgi:3-dehydroquinate synthase
MPESSKTSTPAANPMDFTITSSVGEYRVVIAPGQYASLLAKLPNNTIFICDTRFAAELRQAGCKVIELEAHEKMKDLNNIPEVVVNLRKFDTVRATSLVAVGGGIVQDVVSFVSAIYMRGISWYYYPTTLLGMGDSCIGGKSSINVGEYKNIVGTYTPPVEVRIDPSFADSLPHEQRAAGLVEAAKICFCHSHEAFARYRALAPRIDMNSQELSKVIAESLAAKKWFVETDEFDQGQRLLLNFGHTFGHAVEASSQYAIGHGLAVGVGMLMSLSLSEVLDKQSSQHEHVRYLKTHVRELLKVVPSLKNHLALLSPTEIFDRFTADKKHKPDAYAVVIVDDKGSARLHSLPKNEASIHLLKSAMQNGLESLQ